MNTHTYIQVHNTSVIAYYSSLKMKILSSFINPHVVPTLYD